MLREVIVAGHICLDVIPQLDQLPGDPPRVFRPGQLTNIGPTTLALGGAVANVGLALHRLGLVPRLAASVGDDLFGQAVLGSLRAVAEELIDDMIITPGEPTSYTIVLNPPGFDRGFLHDPGTNATFDPRRVQVDRDAGARLLHFGYPPLIESCYQDPEPLIALFQRAHQHGLLVSLDMSLPDLESPQAEVDWKGWLTRVLPAVDLFLPSLDELLFMLDRELYFELSAEASADAVDTALPLKCGLERIGDLAEKALGLGAGMVGLKLGAEGFYLQSGSGPESFSVRRAWKDVPWERWCDRQLYTPCFEVVVGGTVGAGDTTIAGFLAAILQGCDAATAVDLATAVGACSVEQPDATSGVPSWEAVLKRLAHGWRRQSPGMTLTGFRREDGIWRGPADRQ